jgi:transposase
MEPQRNKVCGVDIHKKFLVATNLSRDGTKDTKRFSMVIDDLLRFRDWVIGNNCEQVALESTSIYWYPIHAVLEGKIDLIVANAYKIKHTPGRKTDVSDSEWIAELCLYEHRRYHREFTFGTDQEESGFDPRSHYEQP